MANHKVWYCENGHHNMAKSEPDICSECDATDFDLSVGSWPITLRGRIPMPDGKKKPVHNADMACNNSPSSPTRTDLGTAAQGNIKLCERCEWPDGAAEFIEDDGREVVGDAH